MEKKERTNWEMLIAVVWSVIQLLFMVYSWGHDNGLKKAKTAVDAAATFATTPKAETETK